MRRLFVPVLRLALIVLLVGSVLGQVVVPVLASRVGSTFPEVANLVGPYSLIGILVIGCGQLVLVVVWRLLSLVSGGVIFTHRAIQWVDVMTACGVIATILSAAVAIHLFAFVGVRHAAVTVGLAACVAGGLAFVLLMVVMKGLLASAIADRTELDDVI